MNFKERRPTRRAILFAGSKTSRLARPAEYAADRRVPLRPWSVVLVVGLFATLGGCNALPRRYVQHTVYNPFPELSRVAIVPFFNHSDEPTVNGAEFARAYFLELQSVPGFEVVPVEVVARTIRDHRLALGHPGEIVRLAELLDVDAVVVGVVTDYRPYYPPRCGLHVEWYARDPSVCPVPPGYGIAWDSRRARKLPDWLKTEAAIAWAREQVGRSKHSAEAALPASDGAGPVGSAASSQHQDDVLMWTLPPHRMAAAQGGGNLTESQFSGPQADPRSLSDAIAATDPPSSQPVSSVRIEPVLVHTRVFSGTDPEVAKALATYYRFREDARFGGWQGYLERSDDFIRFCCRLHIHQMLMARGAVGKKQVVWDWPLFR